MAETFGMNKLIPYSSHISPEIIKLKSGGYLMCFRLRGAPYVGISQDEIDNRVLQINKFLSQLRAPYRYNIYLQSHCLHFDSDAALPNDFVADSFLDRLNREYEDKVIHGAPIITTEYYLSLVYRPYKRIGSLSAVKTTRKQIAEYEKQAEEVLSALKDKLLSSFAEYAPRVLTAYEANGDITYSEPLEFFNKIINLDNGRVPLMRAQISEYLPSATLSLGSSEIIRVDTGKGKTHYATILTISEYPDSTRTGQIQRVLELPWRMVVSQTFAPIDKAEASDWLGREYKRLENMDSGSEQDLEDLLDAREGVRADNFLLGHYYWSIMLIDDSIDDLKGKIGQVTALLADCGITASANSVAKLHSYFAQLPGNIHLQPRAAKVSSLNAAQMMPYQIQSRGKAMGNPWGAAVSMLRTASDDIFYFNFHKSDINSNNTGDRLPGNTMITGQTGAGKTVLLSFLLAQSQRYETPPTTIIFDKDLGSYLFVKAMGGQYSEIKLGEPTGFNPFHLANTESNQAFLNELIGTILEMDGMGMPTASEKNMIADAIIKTLSSPKEIADIEAFANYLPDGDNSIRQRLKPWTEGRYAWVFNNAADNFELNSHIIGVDYTQFLDMPIVRTPILMYLFHRIQKLIDGRPIIISLDEAWKPLQDDKFRQYIEDKERTIRKENGLLILTSQSPSDFFANVPKAMIEQITTQIFLPNPKAKREDYLGQLGLDEGEFTIIKNMGVTSREFLIRYQGETTHCKLNLKGIREVDVMSGSEDRARLAQRLMHEYGNDPKDWLEPYYSQVKNVKQTQSAPSNQKEIR